jgi:metal transporter CNNM
MQLSNSLSVVLTWVGIAFFISQTAILAGLNLAVFSLSRLRLQVEAENGNEDAIAVRELRRDGNLTLSTIVWASVSNNVVLTLLADSLLSGLAAFVFSTFLITIVGEIGPQAYFSRHALPVAAKLAPLLRVYCVLFWPLSKPTAVFLNWWLGHERYNMLGEEDFKTLIGVHIRAEGDVGKIEGTGAQNFLDLDDVYVSEEGEPLDPKSVIAVQTAGDRPILPKCAQSPDDPFLQRLNASGHKWVVLVNAAEEPLRVLDAERFITDVLLSSGEVRPERYWHRPIVTKDPNATLAHVIGSLKVVPQRRGDDVIDNDVILLWADQRRIITGADLLGRLLRGISTVEKISEAKPGERPAGAGERR